MKFHNDDDDDDDDDDDHYYVALRLPDRLLGSSPGFCNYLK